jgi:hypothetical protein
MTILARIDVGQNALTQTWEFEDGHLIIARFRSKAIAIPLDKTRVHSLTKLEALYNQLHQVPPGEEYVDAIVDSIDLAYLGTLNVTDAVLLEFPA